MPFGPRMDRRQPGQPITAAWANRMQRSLEIALSSANGISGMRSGAFGGVSADIPTDFTRWLPFKNNHGTTCPAYGVVRITGVESDGITLAGNRPDGFGAQFVFAVNGSAEVPSNDSGLCTFDSPVWVAYDSGDTVQYKDPWGPTSGNWDINRYSFGFSIIGGEANGRVLCVRPDELRGLGQAPSAGISEDSTGTIDIYYFSSGTWTDTGQNIGSVRAVHELPPLARVRWEYDRASRETVAMSLDWEESGVGQAPGGGITAGSTGTVTIKRWNGASFSDLSTSRTETMRNTSGVDISASAKVSWVWDRPSAQYLCVPLECS